MGLVVSIFGESYLFYPIPDTPDYREAIEHESGIYIKIVDLEYLHYYSQDEGH